MSGSATFSAYGPEEVDAELSRWDSIKSCWDDAASARLEEEALEPMRMACAELADLAASMKSRVAALSDEIDAL